MCLFSVFIYAPLAHGTWIPRAPSKARRARLCGCRSYICRGMEGLPPGRAPMVLGRRKTHRPGRRTPRRNSFRHSGTGMSGSAGSLNAGLGAVGIGAGAMAFATTNTAYADAGAPWNILRRHARPEAVGDAASASAPWSARGDYACGRLVSIGERHLHGTVDERRLDLVVHWKNNCRRSRRHARRLTGQGVGGMVGC